MINFQNFKTSKFKQMKKINLLFVFIFVVQFGFAQNAISDYSFYQSIGEYEEIEGGTVLPIERNTYYPELYDEDEGLTNAVDIGFEFTYAGNTYTQFRASVNGFVSLGETDFTNSPNINQYYLDNTEHQILAPLATDLWLLWETDASVTYKLDGTTGNRILTIQFIKLREDGNYEQTGVNYQIKLYENNNKVEFVYGDMTGAANWSFGYVTVGCGIANETALSGTFMSVFPGYPCEINTNSAYTWISESQIASILEGTTYEFVPVQENDAMSLSVDINENLQYNEAVIPTATFKNHGSQTVTFDATLEIINSDQVIIYTQTEEITNIAAGTSQQIEFSPDWTAEAGDFTVKIYTTLIGDTYIENDTLTKDILVSYLKKAYCYVRWSESGMYPTGPSWFYLEEPDEINNIINVDESINNGAWAEGKWYSIQYNPNQLVYFDTETGAKTVVGATNAGVTIFYGLSYDWSTSTMYAITGYEDLQLYTIDLETGAATLVGTSSSFPDKLVTFACSADGDLFTIGEDGNFYSINKTTAELSLIGSLGLGANPSGAQDMEFDHFSSNLYWYGMIGGGTDAMYTINTITGEATITGNTFSTQVQFCGFAIPYEPGTTFSVTFDITDNLAPEVTLTGYGTQTATGGSTTFTGVEPAQSPGIMYTAELAGYQTYTGYVVVDNDEAVSITLIPLLETFDVTFNIAEGLEPEITLGNYGTYTAIGGTYTFTDVGIAHDPGIAYVVELDGYETISDYVIVEGNETVDITLTPTNIQNIDNNNFKVYPNPSNGIFKIDLLTSVGLSNVKIINVTGKIIYTTREHAPLTIDLTRGHAPLHSGIYFINIQTETGIYTEKLIIQ